uniref:Rieske domain-containing protein n=1 Tax=Neobodo designis TaxID=312471 RepID=A0A7S1MIN1_NEODS|mmetsp:Transcript_41345/g.127785  ORF Transcript_41345/g.127785 Transcript_41345/m.127785 type:complete len:484 (+) Transcript_41345:35-1486(+)|eukprot:CAMPEP_0174854616 /NCGR_PEP_ID=MMETSP1114-20130205/31849_1 /TAXON_ID=312471 /ORGANISM="Neobodo designis, Strain CCAP 1951/1" /LENGTH=483 /DNA_ID=CAMNT_0016089327 /DNA_START=35 /DNA_END=1486 /DNA_ORIENTATION=+
MEIHVCAVADFAVGTRRLVKAGRRNVAVYNHRGNFYAIDNACYHHGGPLLNGDIETLGGHPCVRCPWHSYKITLDTGEGLYYGVELDANQKPLPQLKSKGVKQRTHQVVVRRGDVYVIVDASGGHVESDTYAEMEIANREQATPSNSSGVAGGSRDRGIHSSLGSSQGGGIVDPGRSGAVFGVRTTRDSGASGASVNSVKLVKVTPASAAEGLVATFTFDKTNPAERRRVMPGQWVRLRIPAGPNGAMVDRQWTVSHVRGPHGGWFSITVKHRPEGGGGSRYLFSAAAKNAVVELVEIGGVFTLHHLTETINDRRGRVLMLSAGIGITPIFAAITKQANDPFATVSGPPMHIVHVHSERTPAEMPLAADLAPLHAQWSDNDLAKDPFSYRLRLKLTGSEEQMKASEAAVPKLVRDVPATPGRLTIFDVREALDFLAPVASDAKDANRRVVVMLCGPDAFMAAAAEFCYACGVSRNAIYTEAFD